MNIKIAWQDLTRYSSAHVGNYRLSIREPESTKNVFWVYVDLIWPDSHLTNIFERHSVTPGLEYAKAIAEQQLLIALHSGLVTNER